MTSVPSEGGHTTGLVPVHWLLQVSFLVPVVQARVHKQERIRWSAWQREKSAVRVPGGDSRPIARGSARTPAHKGYANTSDRDLARCLHQPEPFQRTRDADTNPAHLWRKKQTWPVW